MQILAIASLLAQLATATAAPASSPSATAIYLSALRRLESLPQPAFIDSTMHWKVLAQTQQGDRASEFDERVLFDSTARRECVLFVPYTPDSDSIIGSSYFAPDMWLVHKPPERSAQQTNTNFSPDLSDLRTIAAVVTVAKPAYDITLAGTDPLTKGGRAYHLVLKPLSDPWKHNLRELWINTATFDIMRAVLVGDYRPDTTQLVERTTVAEDFGSVGPYWVVIHHTWSYRDAPNAVLFQYDVTDQQMAFPASIPAWYFDERQFARHRSEVNTTAEWPQSP